MTSTAAREALLDAMIRIRVVEELIAAHYSEQRMRCPVHLSVGQEAPAAAFSLAAQAGDYAVSTHRGHAHYLAKGGALGPMIAELHGRATGCSGGRGGSMHLADASVRFMGTSAIVGNSIPVGVGLGLALRIRGERQASAVFLGDGATEEGVFYESLTIAAVRALPVVFLCENNLYSVYSPLAPRQPAGRAIADMVAAVGVPAVSVDGNDAVACLESVTAALTAARGGHGPQFVEFATFRHLEHCGPDEDDHLGYRPADEVRSWRDRDPIDALTAQLATEGIDSAVRARNTRRRATQEVERAFADALAAPFPDAAACWADVYA